MRLRFLSYSPRGPTVFLPVCPSRVKEKWGKWGGGGREREERISRPNIVRTVGAFFTPLLYFQICDRTELNHQVLATFNLANSDAHIFLKKSLTRAWMTDCVFLPRLRSVLLLTGKVSEGRGRKQWFFLFPRQIFSLPGVWGFSKKTKLFESEYLVRLFYVRLYSQNLKLLHSRKSTRTRDH